MYDACEFNSYRTKIKRKPKDKKKLEELKLRKIINHTKMSLMKAIYQL